ncbi:glycosyltransferase [Flavobacterium sp. J49]|uniref:glycosyltransferase n=1 Tax=Flavobacterium sp. J49 TaxID=2718534 RepID=UPI0015944948|nr:glycosyltransferase [Flavobacterium sp. J49]MBF6640015.1 glycosyltransferase [Flavobacterium sp. J49]NIC01260.1 glycosyltransferase [Flavobacterium sp. J49]
MIIFQLIQKPQFRGAELFACQLSGHLETLGHQVYLISLFPGESDLPFSGSKIHLNRPVAKRWFDYQGWKALAQLIQQHQPDVIQCNAGDTLKFAVLSKQFFGWNSPIIARNASMVSLYITNPLTLWINRQLYKNTAAIISVSENSKKDLTTLFPETLDKTTVIPVGIEIQPIKAVAWLGGGNAGKHLIHVGGFSFEKNHEGLLSIFKQFLAQYPDAHLHLLGEGPKKEAIQKRANDLGLQNNITFYGWVSNPVDYIAKADVLVLPSIIEGLPGVILEAMSCKTPVVAYNVGGISEVVDNLTTGYLVPKNEETIFVDALGKVFSAMNQSMIDRAFELVNQSYNNAVIAKQFEKEYFLINHNHR